MKHLDDNNATYFGHMKDAFTLALFGLKIVFYSGVHGIFPFLFEEAAGKTIEKAGGDFIKMKVRNSINMWDGM